MNEKHKLLDLLYQLRQRCIANDNEIITELNISQAEHHYFVVIGPETPMTGNDITALLNLSPSRVSRIIDQMVKKGFLARKADTHDCRAIVLNYTDQGLKVREKIMSNRYQCEDRVNSQISDAKLEQIRENIKLLIKIL